MMFASHTFEFLQHIDPIAIEEASIGVYPVEHDEIGRLTCCLSQCSRFCVVHMASQLGATGKNLATQNLEFLIVEFTLLRQFGRA